MERERRTITLTATGECPECGICRETISFDDLEFIESWAESIGHEIDLRDRRDTGSVASFTHGGGHAILDADLLGGNGDGRVETRFLEDTGAAFEFVGEPIPSLCRECKRYV